MAKHLDKIQVKHFTLGKDVINFINNFPHKDQIFLLADFELLKQHLNGIDVIEKTKIDRAILVTSHYADQTVQNLAKASGVNILPKQLAPEVSIKIGKVSDNRKANKTRKVDIVIIDDNEMITDTTATLLEQHNKKVDKYYNPILFLKQLSQYDKDTIICMDNDLKNMITGVELAKQLHEQGFTKLYLLSGKEFKKVEIPDYLVIIQKTDITTLTKLGKS